MAEKIPTNTVPIKSGKCPMCGYAGGEEYRPFCSKRCADLDLSKWLEGAYKIPTDEYHELDDDTNPND